jgi:hypothetical protein
MLNTFNNGFIFVNFIMLLCLLQIGYAGSCGCGSDSTASVKPTPVSSCCSAKPATNPTSVSQSSCGSGCGAPAEPANQKSQIKGTANSNNDCGIWSLAYVAKSLGNKKDEKAIKKLVSFDPKKGTTMQELALGAQKMGLEAKGYRMSYTELTKRQVDQSKLGKRSLAGYIVYIPNHFMVLTAVDAEKNQLTFADSSKKKIEMPKDEFLSIWQGYVLEVKKRS